MRKAVLFILFIIILYCWLAFLAGCGKPDKRIKRESPSIGSYYEVVTVDKHQYVANKRGGIIHSMSCKCTK